MCWGRYVEHVLTSHVEFKKLPDSRRLVAFSTQLGPAALKQGWTLYSNDRYRRRCSWRLLSWSRCCRTEAFACFRSFIDISVIVRSFSTDSHVDIKHPKTTKGDDSYAAYLLTLPTDTDQTRSSHIYYCLFSSRLVIIAKEGPTALEQESLPPTGAAGRNPEFFFKESVQ